MSCPSGRFREVGPTNTAPEAHTNVCRIQRSCRAGEWTVSVGTVKTDTGCEACPAGRARASAPRDKVSVETASSCTACTGTSEYADERGLTQCKACVAGHFGVVVSGSLAEGGHTACDDDTCERLTDLPANSEVDTSKCADHGRHNGAVADTCALVCKPGFFSSSVNAAFTCAPDSKASTASYQGGAITCTGALVCYVEGWYSGGDGSLLFLLALAHHGVH